MTRSESAAKATKIRETRVKGKIQTALNVLQMYSDKKITVRAIAEEAGISTTTAAKYLKQIKENSQPVLT